MFAAVVRPFLYAACALGGVYAANALRPVTVDAAGAAGVALGGVEAAARQLFAGNGQAALDALGGGAKDAGKGVSESVNAQVKANVILGVVGGCLFGAVVDAVLL